MGQTYSPRLPRRLARPLAALGLLLASAGAARAQTPTATFALQANAPSTGAGSNPINVAIADINGDGKLDALTANYYNGTLGVLLGNGAGGFALQNTIPTGGNSGPYSIATADVNGDGNLDALIANNNSSTLSVLLGDGMGGFGLQNTISTGAGSFPRGVTIADVNGDGKPDALTANYNLSTLGVLLGDGAGGFTLQNAISTGANSGPYNIATADVNGDGKLDALTTNYSGITLGVLLGNGAGGFALQATPSTGASGRPIGLAIADINGDGKLDALTTSINSGTLGVLLGNGAGGFALQNSISTGANSNPYSIAVADVNGDGKLDALTANNLSSTLGVLLGNGAGGFTLQNAISTGASSFPRGVAIADVNGDGKPDALAANYNSSALGVLLNTTVYAAPTLTSLNPNPAAVGTSVTLTGQNLSSATGVSFNGTAATTFAVVNATTITATVPTGATSGPVTVTTGGGTSGGVQLTVTTTPTVTTATPTNITTTSATLGAAITSNGGVMGYTYGLVYVQGTGLPTTSNTIGGVPSVSTSGNGASSFANPVRNLTPGTTYTVRGYATNSVGTAYGTPLSFTTLAPVSGTAVVTNVSCYAGSNGAINLTPTGGVAPYTYRWSDGPTTQDRTNLAAGLYTVTIADAAGATGTVSNIIVTQPTPLTSTAAQTNIACNGGNEGAASVSASGGTGPYTYRWSTGATTPAITGLTAGSYSVSIGDANGCMTSRTIVVVQPSALTATTSQTDVTTNGGSNGTATITVGGGTPNYTYSWSPNVSTTATATGLRAGSYSVTATDAKGCTITRTFNIGQPAATTTVVSIGRLSRSPTNTAQVAYQVVFGASVSGLSPSNFTVTQAGVSGASVSGVFTVGGTGTTYTVVVNTGTGDGTLRLDLTNATGLSPGLTNLPFAGDVYTIDKTPPTLVITSAAAPDGGYTTASPLVFLLTFSEPVTAPNVALTNASPGTSFPINASTYSIGAIPTNPGAVTITLAAYQSPDRAGNYPLMPPTYTVYYNVPTAAPVVVAPANGSTQPTTTPTYRGTAPAGSTVTVLVDNVSIGTTTATTGGSFSLTQPTALTQGSHTVYATAQASGQAASANSNTNTFTVDTVAPTVTITSATAPNGGYTTTSPLVFVVTFSEPVMGYDVSKITSNISNVAAGTLSAANAPTYTLTLTPAAPGAVTLSVPAGIVTDAAGNANAAAVPPTYTIYYNVPTAAPVLTSPTNNSTTATATPTYQGTAPAGSTVTVFVNGTSIGTTTATGGSFSLTQPTALAPGQYAVYATAQASGQAASANSNTNTFTVATAPTITALSPATGPVGTSVTITGTNFTGATVVRFNGTVASSFVVNSATSITAVVAAGTTTGPVSVSTPGGSAFSSAEFVVRVAPVTVADSYSTPQGVTLTGNVLTNDLGTTPRAILITRPANGALVLNPNGSFTYQPNAGFTGTDSFTYYACDQGTPLLCGNPATVTISLLRIAPVTVADSYSTPAGTTLTGNVLTNDLGTNPRAILINRPTNGVLVLNPNGSFTYVPNAGFVGTDSFTYYACDPAMPLLCGNPVTVTITVTRVAPTTVADSYTTPQGVTLTGNVLTNDIGTNPRAILINRPTRGTLVLNPDGSFSYQPNAGFSGSDSFSYYACNMGAPLVCGEPATVSLTVTPASTATRPAAPAGDASPATPAKPAAPAVGGATIALELALTGHPNPFADELQLSFALPIAQAYTLAVYDAQGRLVQQLARGQAEAGQAQQLKVPTHTYAAGLYFVRLTTSTATRQLKLSKQ
jgi:hypothetical protein